MHDASSAPSLPLSTTHSSDGTIHTYLQQEPSSSKDTAPLQHGYSYPLACSGAAVSKPASTTSADESFLIDLPPMSQLDCSVLDALPLSLRNQILRSYEKSVKSEGPLLDKLIEREQQEILALLTSASTSDSNVQVPEVLLSSDPASDQCTQVSTTTHELTEGTVDEFSGNTQQVVPLAEARLVIDNEEEFIKEFRKYIREWIAHSRDGPNEPDALKFTDFLILFTETNLELTQVMLRFLRRLVAQLKSIEWAVYFNSLLVKVQDVTKQCFGGTLKITELDL